MKKAIVLDSNDIKKILAEKYNVPENNFLCHVQSQAYSCPLHNWMG